MGVLSEGVHSFLDLVSAAIAYYTIQEAAKPADDDHPYGHGKLETLSSLVEALLLIVAAALIAVEGYQHLRNPEPIENQWVGIAIMIFSIGASFVVYKNNIQAARMTESAAIHSNAIHFLADVVTSVGVLLGLFIMRFTHWHWIDPLLAFMVAAYIFSISIPLIKRALHELTDTRLPEADEKKIRDILKQFQSRALECHDLKTRRSGVIRHVDFHMVVCGQMSVNDSHKICDDIEEKIIEEFPGSHVNIHVEPCEHVKPACKEVCDLSVLSRRKKIE